MITCFFCGHEALDMQALADHLAQTAMPPLLGVERCKHGLTVRRKTKMRLGSIQCFCGRWFPTGLRPDGKLSTFAAHLQKQGGVEQHLLNIAFPDNTPKEPRKSRKVETDYIAGSWTELDPMTLEPFEDKSRGPKQAP